jgi:Uma2 family endonuclease
MLSAARVTRCVARVPTLPVRPFSVEEYHRLIEAGVLCSGDSFELLGGWIVPKMTINPPHNKSVRLLNRLLARLLGEEWVLQVQGPITLPPDSEPEPDVVVAFGPEDRYDGVNPGPRDVVLVVEVADASLAADRGEKLIAYARARLPVYWIINLAERQVEVYTLPRGGRSPQYRRRQDYGAGETVPVVLAGRHVADVPVDAILP